MEAGSVCVEVREFLAPYIDDTDFGDDDDIFEMGLVNSLMAMQLVLLLEKRYSIKFEGDDLDFTNFRSLNRMQALVEGKLNSDA